MHFFQSNDFPQNVPVDTPKKISGDSFEKIPTKGRILLPQSLKMMENCIFFKNNFYPSKCSFAELDYSCDKPAGKSFDRKSKFFRSHSGKDEKTICFSI